jgi:DNA invertase Pin-like site-specific DNA recombinase
VTGAAKAAIWARVSTRDQHTENQLMELRQWASDLGVSVAEEFVTEDSAWAETNGNGKGAEFEAKRAALRQGLRAGRYSMILVWGIDRLSRKGSEDMQRYLRLLAESGADVRSKHDPWLNTTDPMARELLVGMFATLAKYESQRRSERIKAGLARRKAEGKPTGRQPGAVDKKPRRKSGYNARWERERAAKASSAG